jgi:SAM-dependent methyltransferase
LADDDEPYGRIAEWYDAEFASSTADADWYARTLPAGRALVLGCGTGRICAALAGSREVVGLDLSPAMIAVGRRRHPGMALEVGDMRSFTRGAFSAIAIPNAAFSFLSSRADQAACLAACAAALGPGGLLVIDVPMPVAALLGTPRSPEKPAWEGGGVTRTREVRRFPVAQRLELIDRYYAAGQPPVRSVLRLRLIWPAEIEWMVEAAGMYVEQLLGDYAGRPLSESCPRLIALVRR